MLISIPFLKLILLDSGNHHLSPFPGS
jgi:hypothetical protein